MSWKSCSDHLKGGRGSQVGPDWAMKVSCLASFRLVTFMSVPPWLLKDIDESLDQIWIVPVTKGREWIGSISRVKITSGRYGIFSTVGG